MSGIGEGLAITGLHLSEGLNGSDHTFIPTDKKKIMYVEQLLRMWITPMLGSEKFRSEYFDRYIVFSMVPSNEVMKYFNNMCKGGRTFYIEKKTWVEMILSDLPSLLPGIMAVVWTETLYIHRLALCSYPQVEYLPARFLSGSSSGLLLARRAEYSIFRNKEIKSNQLTSCVLTSTFHVCWPELASDFTVSRVDAQDIQSNHSYFGEFSWN